MQNSTVQSLWKRIKVLDTPMLRGSAVLAIGMAVSRVLGMAFSLVLAAVFVPEDYGAVQYGITVGTLIAIATMPFGQKSISRYIGKYHENKEQLPLVTTNAFVIQVSLAVITLIVASIVLTVLDRFDIGMLVVFAGITLFYSYWGLSTGFFASGRLTIVYLFSNIFQLAVVLFFVYVLNIATPLMALVIYGSAYVIPIAVTQYFKPLPLNLDFSLVSYSAIKEQLRFSMPIWGIHAGHVLRTSLIVLVLEQYSGLAAVGIFSIAGTLSLVFSFIPQAISNLLLPKTASIAPERHRQLFRRMLGLSLGLNLVGFIFYVLLIRWVVTQLFGPEYVTEMAVYILMAIAAIIGGIRVVLTSVLVGRGDGSIEAISGFIALVVSAVVSFSVIPTYGALGAAITAVVNPLGPLLLTIFFIFQRRRIRRKRSAKEKTIQQ